MPKLKKTLLCGIAPLLLSGMLIIAQIVPVSASGQSPGLHKNQNFAKFNKDNNLLRPRNYREWIFIGSSVTPSDMNDGKPAFPEFHNVYIDPASWEHWKKTGKFRDGTIIVLEMVSVGAKESSSGNGYFQGEYNGIAATVKDKKRFGDRPNNWVYFGFESYESPSASAQPDEACAACHKANAAQDMVFTQHYPVLRAAKPGK